MMRDWIGDVFGAAGLVVVWLAIIAIALLTAVGLTVLFGDPTTWCVRG